MPSHSRWVHLDRISGSLTGLLVGDALGVPYEFHAAGALPARELIDFQPPAGFRRSHSSVLPGTWSDDGAQALVLLESLLANNRLDIAHFSNGLVRWMTHGFCAVDEIVFDIGIQTSKAIARLKSGIEPLLAGPCGERDNGNGSLMRVLPLALWHSGSDAELAEWAAEQSLPTHGHVRARIACALYCLWVRCILTDTASPWDDAVTRLTAVAAPLGFPADEMELVLDPANASRTEGSGYVVDSLWSARAAVLETTCYEACVRLAVSFGNDTDTTAAIAGGVAGAIYGLSGIPKRWRTGLRGREILDPLQMALLEHCDPPVPLKPGIKTSKTHPIRIATLPIRNGKLGITFCPGKKQSGALSGTWERDLDTDLEAIRDWGASDIVSLIESQEMVELDVESLPKVADAHGLRWHHMPIVDQQVPNDAFEAEWTKLLPRFLAILEQGGSVVVHCKGGLGRAGTVAARLLMASDPALAARDAMAMVRSVRPGAIENRVQELHVIDHRKEPRNSDLEIDH